MAALSGSPAHAGMVPARNGGGWKPPGFPRPRGDGPRAPYDGERRHEVPPPTRGWSSARHRGTRGRRGSPAHAGMVPPRLWRISRRCWFPRPRGDGPEVGQLEARSREVPPPTRGWSRTPSGRHGMSAGSPAHAGMVHTRQLRGWLKSGFPRPRGDGPLAELRIELTGTVPPPTRGWSLASSRHRRRVEGSPAHAGMVPCSCAFQEAPTRFPRPRGDGPLVPVK